jgi:hypothetical protein
MIVNGILETKKNCREVGSGGNTCVWEVLGSNLVWDTDYPKPYFSWSFSILPGVCRDNLK